MRSTRDTPDRLDKLITLVRNKILTTFGKQRMSEQDTLTAERPMAEEVTHTPDGSIKLGSMVRDVFTGYQGLAMVRERRLTGSVLICVEKKGEVPDDSDSSVIRRDRAKFFDECRLEVVNEDLCRYSSPLDECTIPLGVEVQDMVLGQRGIATRLLEQVNGCVHVFVEYSEVNRETGHLQPVHFHEDHKRFKIVGPGVAEGEDKVEATPTGCCIDSFYS